MIWCSKRRFAHTRSLPSPPSALFPLPPSPTLIHPPPPLSTSSKHTFTFTCPISTHAQLHPTHILGTRRLLLPKSTTVLLFETRKEHANGWVSVYDSRWQLGNSELLNILLKLLNYWTRESKIRQSRIGYMYVGDVGCYHWYIYFADTGFSLWITEYLLEEVLLGFCASD